MATKAPRATSVAEVVELTVFINPRGRSVVHGTMNVDGELRTIKHELSDAQKADVGKCILGVLA